MTQTGTAAGEWVAVPLTDGTVRYDWQPAEQPPSPDGTLGVWRLVPGEVDGYGNWRWFQVPRPSAASAPRGISQSAEPAVDRARIRRIGLVVMVILLVALIYVLTRGGSSDTERPGVSTLPSGQKESRLMTAANAYTTALLVGNGDAAAGYLDRRACGAKEQAEVRDLAEFLARKAPGTSIKVTSVDVNGDDGNVTGYEFSSGVPEDVRTVIEQGYTSGGEFSWHLRNDRWAFDAEC